MLDRVLDQLLQLALDRFQTANVIPRDIRYLDHGLAQGGWVGLNINYLELYELSSLELFRILPGLD